MSHFWLFVGFTVLIFTTAGLITYVVFLKLLPQTPVILPSASLGNAREWIAATSGWFAGIVAIVAALITVGMLSKQIATSSEQHLELMKFQAHEKLVLSKQVQSAASGAHGTLVQILEGVMNGEELTDRNLENFIRAAEAVRKLLDDTSLSEKAYQLLGQRSGFGSYEEALEKWIKAARILNDGPEGIASEVTRREMLKRESGILVILEIDLRHVEGSASDFIIRWAHLSA